MSNKLDTFTNKHADGQLSTSEEKKIQKLLKKEVFKIVILYKLVIAKKIPSHTQIFNSNLISNTKNLCTNQAYKKNRPVVHAYNKKKILY